METAGLLARIGNRILSWISLILILLLLSYGGFSLWHNWVIDHVAFGTDMLSFKPTEEDSLTLQELMALNPDVRGWITIDGTHIDYPLVQGQYDYEYLNKDPMGNYSLSGSIFMSTTNAPDFSDPYTLIYGHHMDNGAMFGDIDLFEKRSFFEEHSTGTLYTKDRTYKVEIFSCVFTDAYDSNIYSQEAQTNEDLVSFEEYAKTVSIQYRPADLQYGDHVIALSTCSDIITNGRHLLLGKLIPLDH